MKQQGRSAGRVQVFVQEADRPQRWPWLSRWLTLGLMAGLIMAAIGGINLAVHLIINPGAVSWIRWLVPDWEESPLAGQAPQTLSEIRATATEAGLQVGSPIYLSTYPGLSRGEMGFEDWLLPFYQPQGFCETTSTLSDCQRLVELRIYRPQVVRPLLTTEPGLALIDQLTITGLEEQTVIAPLVNAAIAHRGSTRKLPYTTITFIKGQAPLPGVWLHLEGTWQRGSNRIIYGQVVRYDPLRGRLQPLQTWTSPAEQTPEWQIVAGDASALVVDQSIGLEPQFQVYQFTALSSPGRPLQITPITLAETGLGDWAYKQGLLLARNGLWSLALQQLEASKASYAVQSSAWTTAAQAQLDFIALHAQITQAQADRDWASPRQQILALLIDGRWTEALTLLQTAHANGYTLNSLLSDPADRLQKRVETALRVDVSPPLQSWGVMLTALRDDRAAATRWLNQQPQVQISESRLQELLSLLETPAVPVIVTASPTSVEVSSRFSPDSTLWGQVPRQIIGTAIQRLNITLEDWFNPDPEIPLALTPNQIWYDVKVEFQGGQRWQADAFLASAGQVDPTQIERSLWSNLGLAQDPQIQLVAWTGTPQPQSTSAVIRAIQFHQGNLRLLVAADASAFNAPSALALTLSSLSWLQPSEVLTLNTLNQQYPQRTTLLLHELEQVLEQIGYSLPPAGSSASYLLKEWGGVSVQQMDVTGDQQLESILVLDIPPPSTRDPISAARPDLLGGSPQTLVFSSQGSLLHNDLTTPTQTLEAFVNFHSAHPPALILRNEGHYQIRQWSAQQQRFE